MINRCSVGHPPTHPLVFLARGLHHHSAYVRGVLCVLLYCGRRLTTTNNNNNNNASSSRLGTGLCHALVVPLVASCLGEVLGVLGGYSQPW